MNIIFAAVSSISGVMVDQLAFVYLTRDTMTGSIARNNVPPEMCWLHHHD